VGNPAPRCHPPLGGVARGAGGAVALLLAALLGGCVLLEDADEARLCRSIIPALDPDTTSIKILSTQRLTEDRGVRILYYTEASASEPRLQSLACTFQAHRNGAAEPRHLTRLQTDEGVLSDMRLHILKRYWLERSGHTTDPSPIANADRVPEIPRAAAVTLQHVLAALPQMAVYALLATAYALVYGLVGRINLAFGDFATLGGYGAFLAMAATGGGSLAVALLAALLAAAWTTVVHGALVGRIVFARVAYQRGQVALIASTGLALFIAEYIRIAQGPGMRWTPPLLNVPIGLARSEHFIVAATPMALVVALMALIAAAGLLVLMRRSRFGRAWRACADDPFAAALMGLSPPRILLAAFVLASLVAGLGGAITTLYYGGVTHSGGLLIGLKALIAAILGGVGSVPGAFLGGLALGAAEALWSAAFPIELRDPAIYALLAIVLAIRPGGFGGSPELEPQRM
jgi:branched-chain amino acid transport system permease protein